MRVFLFTAFFLIISFFSLINSYAYAETIRSFDVSLTAHKDGTMTVLETINYDFENSSRHGVYRYIPLFSRVGDLYRIIKIDDVSIQRDDQKEKFSKSSNKEQIYFKIGDPNKEITGQHIYKIQYSVENALGSNFPQHDEIYWNVTGNDWNVSIEKASITLNTDFEISPNDLKCFTGNTGSTETGCLAEGERVETTQVLYPAQGLTVVAVFEKGTFPPSYLTKEPPESIGDKFWEFIAAHIIEIWLFINLLIPIGLIFWYQKHKNKKRFGSPAVNFDIPETADGQRIPPAVAGTIDTATLERNDVIATLFDLAVRKYIRFEEHTAKRNLLPDTKVQKIIKLKEKDGKLTKFEIRLFDRLFENGSEVSIDDLKKDFYKTFSDMEKDIFEFLVNGKFYVKNPKMQRGLLLTFGIISLVSFNFVLGIVLLFLSKKLIGRTGLGDEIDIRIDGLKLFLGSMNRNYNWQAKKFYTVEQMIPYAMALGYIDKFMEQLKIIKPDYKPSWYSGYSGSFYGSYGMFLGSVNSGITTSAPSSSSGFSGGSSGGGGGGGGGGSW